MQLNMEGQAKYEPLRGSPTQEKHVLRCQIPCSIQKCYEATSNIPKGSLIPTVGMS